MATGSMAEWVIALGILMIALGNAVNLEADSPRTVRLIILAWLASLGIVVIFILAAVTTIILEHVR